MALSPLVAPEPVFDAKAMVASQKRFRTNPSYGGLPTVTAANREAVNGLRKLARRKRRKDKIVGRGIVVGIIGVLSAASFLATRAFMQDQGAAPAGGTAQTDDGSSVGPVAPLGEQVEVIGALGEVNSGAHAGSGGFIGAIDEARDSVGATNDEADDAGGAAPVGAASDDIAEPGAAAIAFQPGITEGARSIHFVYRRWESSDPASAMVEHVYAYDMVDDLYVVDVLPGVDTTRTVYGTDQNFLGKIGADGFERWVRSTVSHDPAPDTPLGRIMTADDLVPIAAAPFANAVGSEPTNGGTRFGYTIDTVAWRAADPGSFLNWVATWHPHGPDDALLVLPADHQVARTGGEYGSLGDAQVSSIGVDVIPVGAAADVRFAIDDQHHVLQASIIDPVADFRSTYDVLGTSDEVATLQLGNRGWVGAP